MGGFTFRCFYAQSGESWLIERMHRRLTPQVEGSLFVGKRRNVSGPASIPLPSQADNSLQGRRSKHEASPNLAITLGIRWEVHLTGQEVAE